MGVFRAILLVLFIALAGYTAVVIGRYGINFAPYFFGDMMRLGWPGQFNADFLTMLTLSAIWTAWRNKFSAQGLGLAVLAFLFGGGFLCLYLLFLIQRHRGNAASILLGDRRRSAL